MATMFLNHWLESFETEINEKDMMVKITKSGQKIVVTLWKMFKKPIWGSKTGFFSHNTRFLEHE